MQWADAVPNLLIGLREGLEAGLVVSILLAAVGKLSAGATDADVGEGGEPKRPVSSTPVWLGVLGAVMLAGSFAAVLTYSTDALSSRAQQAVGGVLSVLAVGLVTGMVFWMRRTARTLSSHLRGDVARAVSLGAGALTITAFLAVSREGLETTLFIWTAAKASTSTVAPLVGTAIGLAAAVVVCWLLYQRAVRLNLGKFFNRTAIALIVIAAGVLAYGLRDLQEAGWLPGQRWIAFDATAHVDPNSWWMSIITGVTQLTSKMTVLQSVAWIAYLAVVIPAFVAAGRAAASAAPPAQPAASAAGASTSAAGRGKARRWERLVASRAWPIAGVLVIVPALVAGLVIALLPSPSTAAITAVNVTGTGCGQGWAVGHTGTQTFTVTNNSSKSGEITLLDSSGAIVAEVETLGPRTTATMSASLGPGQYSFACLMGGVSLHGAPVQVSGQGQSATMAVKRVTVAELTGPNNAYQTYASGILARLAGDVATLRAAVASDDWAKAKIGWLAAQMDWERVGASYNSFGDAGQAVDGLADGLPAGVNDPGFIGLHRVEYGLYHAQSAASLLPAVDRLANDVATVRAKLSSTDEAGDPTNLPLRVHEILEDALRDHLSGIDDQGSGMAYPATYADSQVTRTVLGEVSGLLNARMPRLVPTINAQLDTLQAALLATQSAGQWQPVSAVPLAARQRVNAALGTVLESLSAEPTLLEIPPTQ
ncbi:iron uptake transporter permease EfeU [Rugosimonospora acidiphila]|uniref:iron uptake transporter permease EfeU n=1 Tax=Rugosimonospora acidiphila TaxID=556531 RepID=UPI0031F0F13C